MDRKDNLCLEMHRQRKAERERRNPRILGRKINITDCKKSLEEHLNSDTMNKVDDKRLSIDTQALRQLIWEDADGEEQDELHGQLPDIIQWIDTSKMLADALTKEMNANEFRATLKQSGWNVTPSAEAQVTKLKKQKYRREKRLAQAVEEFINSPQDNS